jgi:hypothetical protein
MGQNGHGPEPETWGDRLFGVLSKAMSDVPPATLEWFRQRPDLLDPEVAAELSQYPDVFEPNEVNAFLVGALRPRYTHEQFLAQMLIAIAMGEVPSEEAPCFAAYAIVRWIRAGEDM